MGKKNIEYKQTQKLLRYDLNEQEQLEASSDLARVLDEIENVENEKKAAMEHFKYQTSELEARRGKLKRMVRDKYVLKDIDCEQSWDYDHGTVTTIRKDLGDVVDTREMTQAERQMPLVTQP